MITQLNRNWWRLAWRGMIPVLIGLAILAGAFEAVAALERRSAWDNLIEREMIRVR